MSAISMSKAGGRLKHVQLVYTHFLPLTTLTKMIRHKSQRKYASIFAETQARADAMLTELLQGTPIR